MNQPNELPPFLVEAAEDEAQEAQFSEALSRLEGGEAAGFAPQTEKLVELVASAPMKYAPFFDRAAAMLETSVEEVERLLEPTGFRRSPLRGITYKAGPPLRTPGMAGTIVRFAPGVVYPRHRHKHHERLLVLEGGYVDDSGERYSAGDVHEMPPGSEHGFTVDLDGPCVGVAVADEKLEFSSFFLRFLARLIGR